MCLCIIASKKSSTIIMKWRKKTSAQTKCQKEFVNVGLNALYSDIILPSQSLCIFDSRQKISLQRNIYYQNQLVSLIIKFNIFSSIVWIFVLFKALKKLISTDLLRITQSMYKSHKINKPAKQKVNIEKPVWLNYNIRLKMEWFVWLFHSVFIIMNCK